MEKNRSNATNAMERSIEPSAVFEKYPINSPRNTKKLAMRNTAITTSNVSGILVSA